MSIFPDDFDPTYEDYVTKFLEYEEETEEYLWNRGDLLVEFTQQPTMETYVTTATGEVETKKVTKTLRSLASDVYRHHKTLERWRFTALIFPPDKRIADLSFSHHTAAAYSKVPEYWIQEAADKEWSTYQLKQAIKAAEHPEEAWVSKTVRGSGTLTAGRTAMWDNVDISGEDFFLQFAAKDGDPIRLGLKLGKEAQVEVEASIRIRRK